MASTHAGFGTVTGPSGSVSFEPSDAKNGVTIHELYVVETTCSEAACRGYTGRLSLPSNHLFIDCRSIDRPRNRLEPLTVARGDVERTGHA